MSKSRPDVSKITNGFFITINGDTGSCFNSTRGPTGSLLSDPRVAGQLVYIISEETSIIAPQRLPFYEALGVAACTVGKVRASTVFMCVCSTFRPSDCFTIRQKRIRSGSTYAERNSGSLK